MGSNESTPTDRSARASRSSRPTRLIAGGVGGTLLILLGVLGVALWQDVGQADSGRSDAGGTAAAEFTVPRFPSGDTVEGDPFVLADYAEQPVFIYFWASWCAPCREEAPVIEALWPEYRDRGVMFLGLNIWDIPADAEAFLAELDLTFPLARDAERSVYVEYGVEGLPVAFFLDPGLRIRSRYDGALGESTLRALLDEIAEAGGSS